MSRAIAMFDDALARIRDQAAALIADLRADPFTTLEQLEHEAALERMGDAEFAAACGDPAFEAYGVRARDCCGHGACDQGVDGTHNDLPDDEPESSAGGPAAASDRLITGPTQCAAVERGVEAGPRRGVRGGRKHRRGGPDAIRSRSRGLDSPCSTVETG